MSDMKNFAFIISIIFLISCENFSQVNLEFRGGFIYTQNHDKLFAHNENGKQGSLMIIYPLSKVTQITGNFIYQTRNFNPESFSFIIPLVVGYPVPIVTNGDNLNSYGLLIGTRIASKSSSFINTFLSAEAGLVYHSESYYELNQANRIKYSDSKTLFEYSFGIGFSIKVIEDYRINIDGKLAHIPSEGIFYFPINFGFQISL